ncbi:DUF427 domain-containing protein [Aureimonas sp. Leaf324]|jgi:uncharacterized protein (DUF427 family)|uniref:DUF427 domain-containing protein n=1 Tax=Aureimonas sp. Leaf324 TaxID=1736336 RepID=UPI0006FA3F87|nr:DUF427 domain-containing protein [Aureimonas sp. Leaf324]KQQ90351.1 hypothetical protein ASF65_16050 [Aureimonas sp. Leaf324]
MSAVSQSTLRVEREPQPVNVTFHDTVIASTTEALRLYEGNREPVLYIPREHVEMAYFDESDKRTTCPLKGEARYWSISAGGYGETDAVWSYDDPKPAARQIAGYLAFYPDKVRIVVGQGK